MIAKKANNFTEFFSYIKKRYNVYYMVADLQISYDLLSKQITFVHKNKYYKYSNSAYLSTPDVEDFKRINKFFLECFMSRTINADFEKEKALYGYYMINKSSSLIEELESLK